MGPATRADCTKIESAVTSGAKLTVLTDDGEFPIATAACMPAEKADRFHPLAALSTVAGS